MAELRFDIQEFFGKVGWRLPFPFALSRIRTLDEATLLWRDKKQGDQLRPPDALLGKPIFAEMSLGGLSFEIPPLVTVRGKLNVVETEIVGKAGTVKEVTSLGEYMINMRGFLSAGQVTTSQGDFVIEVNNPEFPEQDFLKLRAIFEAGQSVEVTSYLMSLFNITRLLIISLNFPETEGFAGVMPFEIECVSDRDVELTLDPTV